MSIVWVVATHRRNTYPFRPEPIDEEWRDENKNNQCYREQEQEAGEHLVVVIQTRWVINTRVTTLGAARTAERRLDTASSFTVV